VDDPRARALLDAQRERLTTIETDLRTEGLVGESESEELAELSVADQHPADIGTETADRSRDLGMLEDVEGELRDIEEALARLQAGSYGRCEVCGKPIPDERLEANPTARYDIEHERGLEAGGLRRQSAPPQ